jgi:hypothetical protein
MNKPVKPVKPSKPYPPSKDKKHHKHDIDISHLFIKEKYFDYTGKEISEEEYENGDAWAFEKETEEATPSIKSLLDLVPAGVNPDNVFIDLQLGYDSGRNYDCRPFQSISVFYTTPYSYEDELAKYNLLLKKYEKSLLSYNEKMKQYKIELEKYKEYTAKLKMEKKKQLLKEQLSILEKGA